MDSNYRVLAIVPAYNEQDSIVSTIEDLTVNAPNIDYLIVNDGSKDNTLQICKEKGYNYLSLPVNLGLAGAFQAGMKYAYENNYDYAVQFDADGQHSGAYIHKLVQEAKETSANIVVGSRFYAQKKPISARMFGSAIITTIIFITTGKKIKDPTSGMRLFDKTLIPILAYELDFGPEPDTIAYLMRRGYKVEEVQVEMRERLAGNSYLSFTKSVFYMLRISLSILVVQWFRRKK